MRVAFLTAAGRRNDAQSRAEDPQAVPDETIPTPRWSRHPNFTGVDETLGRRQPGPNSSILDTREACAGGAANAELLASVRLMTGLSCFQLITVIVRASALAPPRPSATPASCIDESAR